MAISFRFFLHTFTITGIENKTTAKESDHSYFQEDH